MTYLILKFLHVTAASAWMGGLLAVTLLDARMLRAGDPHTLGTLAEQGGRLRRAVIGPSAGLTLIAGGLASYVAGIGWPLWIDWGLAAIVLSIVLGATIGRRIVADLSRVTAMAEQGDARITALRRRLLRFDAVMILIVVSTVWMMVVKPTL
ncbi:MAG TPA: DUF2269 family protein [Woeseiaceae bacterium]|jgi:uncharacterized membrane protein|nr:DUF2269 family protein [Woeseiaceae bacterium]